MTRGPTQETNNVSSVQGRGRGAGQAGVPDPDFADFPLGGSAGTIEAVEQVEDRIDYEVGWDRKALDAMHPVYKNRCERDGLELESMWLGDDDLEPDDGTPVPIELPTQIVSQPLSEKDQDDRVRMALGLTHDDPLPEVGRKTLLAYYHYQTYSLKPPSRPGSGATALR